MKRLLNVFLIISILLVIAVALAGCEFGKKSTDKKEASLDPNEKIDYANMSVDDLLSRIKDKNNVTVDEYVWLISTYSYVKITDDFTLEKNITDEALKTIDSKAKPKQEDYMEKLIKSDSPQVRGYALSLMPTLTGVSKNNLELAKELIKTETDEFVLYNAVKALSNEAKSAKEVADFLIKMASNENSKIRVQAASALGNTWSQGVEGAVDTIIALMNDKDIEVRKAACKNAGKLNDEKVIEPLVKILNNYSDADIHGSCVEGLTTLWYDYPFFKNTSEKAYNATMDYFKKTPRTDKVPAWTGVGAFKTTSTQDFFKEWKQKATYFNTSDLYNIMVEIIKDGNANYLARTAAIDEIKSHCTDEQFSSLKTIIDGLTDAKSSSVKSAYDNKAK